MANLLVERTQNANWVVVYKSLLTVHHLLAYGNEVSGRRQILTQINLFLKIIQKGIMKTLFTKFILGSRVSRKAKHLFATISQYRVYYYWVYDVYATKYVKHDINISLYYDRSVNLMNFQFYTNSCLSFNCYLNIKFNLIMA